jgi:hypothetical protein
MKVQLGEARFCSSQKLPEPSAVMIFRNGCNSVYSELKYGEYLALGQEARLDYTFNRALDTNS